MTKEELEKETEEYLHNNYCCKNSYCEFNTECKERVRIRCTEFEILEKHIVNFAEPREKRIVELEAQIEKMKCCSNCDNWNWKHNKCEKKLKGDCFKHSKWVMRNF